MTIASHLSNLLAAAVGRTVFVSIPRREDKSGWRVSANPPLTAQEAQAAQVVIDAFDPAAPLPEKAREDALLADADRQDLIGRLATATPAQIKSYVDSNVTNLATAKTMLAKVILAMALMVRR